MVDTRGGGDVCPRGPIPTANEVRSEISALYKAAAQRDFERAASLLGSLSQGALALFEEPPLALEIKANSQCAVAKTSRAERVRSRKTRQSARPLPSPSELRDDASRDQACATIEGLCRIGGQLVEGRRRPLGKRSRANFRPHLSRLRQFDTSRNGMRNDDSCGVFRLRGVKQLANNPLEQRVVPPPVAILALLQGSSASACVWLGRGTRTPWH